MENGEFNACDCLTIASTVLGFLSTLNLGEKRDLKKQNKLEKIILAHGPIEARQPLWLAIAL